MNLEKEIFDISLQDIIPNRFQPREMFDDEALQELSQSIKEHGVIQPIIVRKVGDKYEIIAGERRYRASHLAGKKTIPALVRDIDDKEAAKIALLENLQRSNLTPIEEAKTYQTILKLDNITQDELAQNLGKSQSTIANKLRLLTLDEEVQTALLNSQISERHARSLIGLNHSKQKELLNKIINEKLTVRQLDEAIIASATGETINNQIDFSNNQNQSERISENAMNQNSIMQSSLQPDKEIENQSQNPIINNIQQTSNPPMQETPINSQNNQNIDASQINFENLRENEASTNQEYNNQLTPNEIITPQKTDINVSNNFIQEDIEIPSSAAQTNELNKPSDMMQKNNVFEKLRIQNNEEKDLQMSESQNKDEKIIESTKNEQTNQILPDINLSENIIKDSQQENNSNYNNIYDLRFAINNFRQAIQNTEKFGFKIKAEEYDTENKYQIVIEIDKKN